MPIDLPVETAGGETLRLSAYRGRPTLLFLFATYDSASQLAWTPLLKVRERFAHLQLLGIALQPGADRLLDLYGETLGIRDPLTFDPSGEILAGHTGLGPIEAIPGYVLLSAEGTLLARHTGAASASELEAWLRSALE
ncbi:MAG: hypothetical protein OXU20_25230 [Myxococcales bacterium]|nr:hypothetical protein [Myxococcales bacterium]MDD9970610.1 hypothetical protein [Myxococcales bacterium]